jgi:hypothetical protein
MRIPVPGLPAATPKNHNPETTISASTKKQAYFIDLDKSWL